jgi:chromosome segregation ATPase
MTITTTSHTNGNHNGNVAGLGKPGIVTGGIHLSAAELEQELAQIREQERQAKERSLLIEQQLQQVKHREWQARASARQHETASLEAELAAIQRQVEETQVQLSTIEEQLARATRSLAEIRARLLAGPLLVESSEGKSHELESKLS